MPNSPLKFSLVAAAAILAGTPLQAAEDIQLPDPKHGCLNPVTLENITKGVENGRYFILDEGYEVATTTSTAMYTLLVGFPAAEVAFYFRIDLANGLGCRIATFESTLLKHILRLNSDPA